MVSVKLSQQQLEKYSYKINKLIKDAKYGLNIPIAEVYKKDTLKVINRDWEQVLSKLEEAQRLIQIVLKWIAADGLDGPE